MRAFAAVETLDGAIHTDGPWTQDRFSGYDPTIYWSNDSGDHIPATAVKRLWVEAPR